MYVVLNPRDATLIRGTWTLAPDDLHGQILTQPDAGTPKIGTAAASPANYFEFTFYADANIPYHLWIHGRARNDAACHRDAGQYRHRRRRGSRLRRQRVPSRHEGVGLRWGERIVATPALPRVEAVARAARWAGP